MARVIWKGILSFGLVEIPVGLYSATQQEDLSFSLLDERDKAPIGYRKINKRTGEEVPNDVIVKAYELDEDEYVILTDDDFRAANVRATRTIDILSFADQADVDPDLFEKPYFLAPTRKGSKAYALLREALRRTGKVGVAKFVMRSRQYLGVVRPKDNVLVLDVLRYAHELRSPSELDVPGEDLEELGVRDRELQMAEQLVTQLSDTFDASRFRDEYRDDLLALIHEKAERGETATVARLQAAEDEDEGARVVDLMALLKQSVEKVRGKDEKSDDEGDKKPSRRRKRDRTASA